MPRDENGVKSKKELIFSKNAPSNNNDNSDGPALQALKCWGIRDDSSSKRLVFHIIKDAELDKMTSIILDNDLKEFREYINSKEGAVKFKGDRRGYYLSAIGLFGIQSIGDYLVSQNLLSQDELLSVFHDVTASGNEEWAKKLVLKLGVKSMTEVNTSLHAPFGLYFELSHILEQSRPQLA